MRHLLYIALLAGSTFAATAQQNVHPTSSTYEWPTDPQVKAKLDQWQDQKFGIIIHWGLYAVPGILESWTICNEDWIDRDSTISYEDYKKWYWGLKKDFNPVNFNPERWAAVARQAGMRYLVFTTKHHDGFCMFDTKQTDFSIATGPFANNPKKDVANYVFDAFRKEGLMIGAYFSKPDWHTEYFWWPKYATANRNVNYDIRRYPWRWNKYKEFTYNQIQELMTNYGTMDILWLDGGWVRPRETVNAEVLSWGAPIPDFSQEVDIPKIATMARQHQPGLLVVDRTVHGPYENYQTPEQRIPEKQLDHPWESCMTLTNNWGYIPNDPYKSSTRVIHSLIEIVAKGGSLLLGVGPRPDGTLALEAEQKLAEIGEWMKVNGPAIYNTRTVPDYHQENVWFTRSKDSKTFYAIHCFKEGDAAATVIRWKGNVPKKGTKVKLLQTGKLLPWTLQADGSVEVSLPATFKKDHPDMPAVALAFTPAAA